MNRVPDNQTVSFSVYMQAIHNALPVPAAFIRTKLPRIGQAFDMGEPVEMIVAELRLLWTHRPRGFFHDE